MSCSAVEAVLRDLPRHQVAEGDDHLLLLGVAFQRDDLHAVAQRVGHGVEHVGGGDEQDLGEVEGNVQVVVAVGGVLLGVEHFEQGAGRVAAEIAAELIDFVEHEDRVVGAGAAQRLNDLPGQRADVGAAVAADLGLVVHAAHGDAREFAAEGARDGAAQRSLAHAGRSDEAQDGAFQHGLQLQHRQVIQDALLHLFQVVVIFVQDFGGAFHIDMRARRNGPRQAGHPFQVGARHAVFGRCGRHARQPVEFAQGLGLDRFGHAGGFQFAAQFLDIAVGVVAFAEFLLDGLELLAQVELALVLRQLSLHLGLDAAAQFDQFEFARQIAVDFAEPRLAVELFQQVLALGVSQEGQRCRQCNRPAGPVRRCWRR